MRGWHNNGSTVASTKVSPSSNPHRPPLARRHELRCLQFGHRCIIVSLASLSSTRAGRRHHPLCCFHPQSSRSLDRPSCIFAWIATSTTLFLYWPLPNEFLRGSPSGSSVVDDLDYATPLSGRCQKESLLTADRSVHPHWLTTLTTLRFSLVALWIASCVLTGQRHQLTRLPIIGRCFEQQNRYFFGQFGVSAG